MGIVHKLKPEIKEFILKKKQAEPILSCRGLAVLIEDSFKIKISKSTINAIIKEAKLSMPVGRRRKKRRRLRQEPPLQVTTPQETKMVPVPIKAEMSKQPEQVQVLLPQPSEVRIETQLELQNLGLIWLKAADYLLGGANYFSEEVKRNFNQETTDILAKIEEIIYSPLWESPKEVSSYLNELQRVKELPLGLLKIISELFRDIGGIKVVLSNGAVFYLDSQFYTVWSTPYIPSDFSSTTYNMRGYVNRYLKEDAPFVILMAPGYDRPTKEFFDFMLSLEGAEKSIDKIALYEDKLKELELIWVAQNRRRYFVFGMWPWQFIEFRKVNQIGEFRPFRFEPLNLDFYLADAEIELSQPDVNKSVTIRGCALKTSPKEKIRLLILSNLPSQRSTAEQIAELYLAHWPNLEEAFRDFSRKIELFTYTANSRHFLSTQSLPFEQTDSPSLQAVFNYYFKLLDYYVRWHFLPAGYENKDFSTVQQQFYSLKAKVNLQKELILVFPQVPSGYPLLKDLEYACCRLNEREIKFSQDKRLFFSVAS